MTLKREVFFPIEQQFFSVVEPLAMTITGGMFLHIAQRLPLSAVESLAMTPTRSMFFPIEQQWFSVVEPLAWHGWVVKKKILPDFSFLFTDDLLYKIGICVIFCKWMIGC